MNQYRFLCALAAFFLLLFLLHFDSQAQDFSTPLVISERVGAHIEPEERAYFGLFPRTTSFASAAAYPTTDSTAAFLIALQGQTTPDTLEVRMESIVELGRFIDHFEYRYQDKHVVDWGLIIRFVRPIDHLRKGESITLILTNGEVVSGQLVYADTAGVVLTKETSYPAQLFQPEQAMVFAPSEIKHIRFGGLPLIHREVYIPEATHGHAYEVYTIRRLRKKMGLTKAPSPEIRGLFDRQLKQKNLDVPRSSIDYAYIRRFEKRLHVLLYPPYVLSFAPSPISYRVDFSQFPEDEYSDDQFGPDWRSKSILTENMRTLVKLDYRLSRKIGLGIMTSYIPGPQDYTPGPEGKNPQDVGPFLFWTKGRVDVQGFVLQPFVTLVLKSYEPFPYLNESSILDPVEIRVSVGPSLAYFKVNAELHTFFAEYNGKYLGYKQNKVGGFASVDTDIYFNRFISLGSDLQALWIPSLEIREIEVETAHYFGTKHLQSTTQPLFRIAFHAGIRLHL